MRKFISNIPTMKKWGFLSWSLTIIITSATMFSAFSGTGNSDVLVQICALSWADTGVFTGAYAFKERAENKKKIAVGLVKSLARKYGIENIAPLIQTIISE